MRLDSEQKVRRNQLQCSKLDQLEQRHVGVLATNLVRKAKIVLELA